MSEEEAMELAKDRADWLLDAIACATQDRRFLRGDPEYDAVAGDAILLNGEKAIRDALGIQALASRSPIASSGLEEALIPFVRHTHDCAWTKTKIGTDRCSCGLDKAISALRQALASRPASPRKWVPADTLLGELGKDGHWEASPQVSAEVVETLTERQDRPYTADPSISTGNSEIEPDDRQKQGSGRTDRQGGKGREVGGRSAFLPSGLQRSERDVRGENGEGVAEGGAATCMGGRPSNNALHARMRSGSCS